jgi:hypothetical protein
MEIMWRIIFEVCIIIFEGLYFIVVAYKLINSADVKLFAIDRLVYTIDSFFFHWRGFP